MSTLDDLQRIALGLNPISEELKQTSHYKVNCKVYELMKPIKHSGIVYHPDFDIITLYGKPVFIDEDLEDGIATYKHEEPEVFEPVDFYNVHLMTVRPMPVSSLAVMNLI